MNRIITCRICGEKREHESEGLCWRCHRHEHRSRPQEEKEIGRTFDEAIDDIVKAHDLLGQAFPPIHRAGLNNHLGTILKLREELQELALELGNVLEKWQKDERWYLSHVQNQ